jgi:hypothetical protein
MKSIVALVMLLVVIGCSDSQTEVYEQRIQKGDKEIDRLYQVISVKDGKINSLQWEIRSLKIRTVGDSTCCERLTYERFLTDQLTAKIDTLTQANRRLATRAQIIRGY